MAEAVTLVGKKREGRGTRKAAKLRKEGLLPAVLYGHKEATVSLAVVQDDFTKALRHGARVVDLQVEGGKLEKALIRDVQWDHLGMHLIHVDFARVSADERIKVEVRIELRGIAPGLAQGGVLNQPLHSLEIECLALAVPESIRVPVGELQLDQAIYIKDLKLPEGVKVFAQPDAIVVQLNKPEEAAATTPEVEATTAEPEVIGRQAKPEGEEAE